MRFVTIDPGLGGTGWAVWDTEVQIAPLGAGVWVAPGGKYQTWVTRSMWLAEKVSIMCASVQAEACHIEYPIFFDDAGGHMGMKTGDVPKLIFLVGTMAHGIHLLGNVNCHLPTVRDWKGQLSKEQVMSRVRKRLGEAACQQFKSHDWDAVGMGLAVQKLLTLKSPPTKKRGGLARVVRSGSSRTATSSKKS